MADQLGYIAVNGVARFSFTTNAAAGSPIDPDTPFEAADLRIYKNGSNVQRTSTSGITMTSPWDSIVGGQHVDIDLSDNTDAGFYASGSVYEVWLTPDETVDGLPVVKVLAYFTIGPPADTAGDTTLLSRLTSTRAGYLDNLSAGAVALQSTLVTVAGYIDTEVQAILDKFTGITSLAQWLGLLAGKQVGNTTARTELNATGAGGGTYNEVTDSLEANRDNIGTAGAGLTAVVADVGNVWDVDLADHLDPGSTGEALAAAGASGDPWITPLPGAYAAGTAGQIVGDNLNATVSSRATQTSVDDLPTNAELAAALAASDDAVLAVLTLIQAAIDTLPTGSENAIALLDLADAIEVGLTVRGALRLGGAADAGVIAGVLTPQVTLRNAVANSKVRITAAIDASNNRTAVLTDVT